MPSDARGLPDLPAARVAHLGVAEDARPDEAVDDAGPEPRRVGDRERLAGPDRIAALEERGQIRDRPEEFHGFSAGVDSSRGAPDRRRRLC